ncbi:MAG TPA: hypothetical protein VHA33_28445 [Candidatus Angelobacter sp.]|jgi:hypothetical protein|nr:hypothetical protein [Candidatus Angelobacter sp.]
MSILAVIVSALSASFAFWYGRRSATIAERSTRAAEVSAKASEESARLAAEGMQLAQRAYLSVVELQYSQVPSVNKTLGVNVILRNPGNSPAMNIRIAESIDIRISVSTMPLTYPDHPDQGFDAAPGTDIVREYHYAVTQEHVDAIANDTKRLYVWGWARYNDIFGKEHWTKWCYEYSRFTGRSFTIVSAYHKMEQ